MTPIETVYQLIEQYICCFPKIELRGSDYSTKIDFQVYVKQVIDRCRKLDTFALSVEQSMNECNSKWQYMKYLKKALKTLGDE